MTPTFVHFELHPGRWRLNSAFFRPRFAALDSLRHLAAVIRHRQIGMANPETQNILRGFLISQISDREPAERVEAPHCWFVQAVGHDVALGDWVAALRLKVET